MKKLIKFFKIAVLIAVVMWVRDTNANTLSPGPACLPGGPVTTIAAVSVCTGTTEVDIPVTVTSFASIGSISLKITFEPTQLGTPVLLSSHPDLWSSFLVNVATPGTILVSGFGTGISLADGSILFTLRFTNGTGLRSGSLSFFENIQGSSCEYTLDDAPNYTPYCDRPTGNFYINGGLTVNTPSFVPVPHTVAELQATGTDIKWYAAETGGTELSPSTILENGHHYYATQTVNGSESISRFEVTASVDPTPCAPTATSPQSGVTVADLAATGQNIRWYTASSGGTALAPSTALENGTYWASQTIDCTESATRVAVTVSN